jgi:hypothetical protein
MSVSEYFLRAAIERATGNGVTITNFSAEQEDRETRRLAAIDLLASGYFARTGLSTEDLFEDRREELRHEAEQEAEFHEAHQDQPTGRGKDRA